jgi:hypothetical protein
VAGRKFDAERSSGLSDGPASSTDYLANGVYIEVARYIVLNDKSSPPNTTAGELLSIGYLSVYG